MVEKTTDSPPSPYERSRPTVNNLIRNRIIASTALAATLGASAFGLASLLGPTATEAATPTTVVQTHHVLKSTQPDPADQGHVPFTVGNIWAVAQGSYHDGLQPNTRYQPAPGTFFQKIAESGGAVGQYDNNRGDAITIGAAHGPFTGTEKQIAGHSTEVAGYGPGVHVYELHGGGTYLGDYEVFDNGYWFSLSSDLFTSPQAAAPLIQAAIQTIPAG
jgi:hypothetical protein